MEDKFQRCCYVQSVNDSWNQRMLVRKECNAFYTFLYAVLWARMANFEGKS
jgi:hypothetical protein